MAIGTTLNRVLRHQLGPERYFAVRYLLPRRLIGTIRAGAPKVRSFSQAGDPTLGRILESVAVYRTTPLCRIMARYGSDKSAGHTYTVIYSALFEGRREQIARVFEVGLGTIDLSIPSNMGPLGKPGASLRAWREYFPRADVFGADIDTNVLFAEPRIATFYCDQTNRASIDKMWSDAALAQGFDVIIDDGLHEFEANRLFLEASLPRLNRRGFFVVEDVSQRDLLRWSEFLPRFCAAWPDCTFCIVELPGTSEHEHDNNLIVIGRREA